MNSKYALLLLFSLSHYLSFSQFIPEPPYVLSVDELKAWTFDGETASDQLIATTPLAERFVNVDTQFNPAISNDTQIAYLPDGMNNFANYAEEQEQFNLYNFTQWAYIDQLIWFGGTASQNVQLPSAPWVNAAHKNGVKVLGNVFFAPNQFGGSTQIMNNFLEQDNEDNFIVIPIMIEMMEYYNFDGWFINEETDTNATTAQLMYEFLRDLTTAVEALGKEVMWYDAMTLSGSVNWQNRLNEVNSPFLQNDQDNNASNGFEQRVSSTMFINFFWAGSSLPSQSKQRAATIGRSEFEVFTGIDLWPGRNQGRFETAGNGWMSWLHENATTARTSIGLFATNCVYNNQEYSNFNNDPNDYANFYSEERHMFAGADRNPSIRDISGFRGYANWIPASSTITQIPFETNFNTGHGFKKFEEGLTTEETPWHNMNDQDILPNWQFAFSEDSTLSGNWNFNKAFNGGNSLHISGSLIAGETNDLILYKTALELTEDSKIDLIYEYRVFDDSELSYVLTFNDAPSTPVVLPFNVNDNAGWAGNSILLEDYAGRTLATIGLRFKSELGIPNYTINIGNIRVHNGETINIEVLDVDSYATFENDIQLIYPKNRNDIVVIQSLSNDISTISYAIHSIEGKLIQKTRGTFQQNKIEVSINNFSQGVYLMNIQDTNGNITSKKLIVR